MDSKFYKGCKVYCITDYNHFEITPHKEYVVIDIATYSYMSDKLMITNDLGHISPYRFERFITKEEYRNIKIKNLCI